MKTHPFLATAATLLLATFCLAPAYGQTKKDEEKSAGAAPTKAIAELHALKDSGVSGTVTFTREKDGVRVVADVKGLKPGEHGFHIHEKGDCSDPEGQKAGAHFNPTSVAHGAPDSHPHHAGDFGNLKADDKGNAKLSIVSKDLTFEGPNSILDRSVIVHADPDDLKSQPSGNAGARLACGVIKAAGK